MNEEEWKKMLKFSFPVSYEEQPEVMRLVEAFIDALLSHERWRITSVLLENQKLLGAYKTDDETAAYNQAIRDAAEFVLSQKPETANIFEDL